MNDPIRFAKAMVAVLLLTFKTESLEAFYVKIYNTSPFWLKNTGWEGEKSGVGLYIIKNPNIIRAVLRIHNYNS
jgi:hypothetical protein